MSDGLVLHLLMLVAGSFYIVAVDPDTRDIVGQSPPMPDVNPTGWVAHGDDGRVWVACDDSGVGDDGALWYVISSELDEWVVGPSAATGVAAFALAAGTGSHFWAVTTAVGWNGAVYLAGSRPSVSGDSWGNNFVLRFPDEASAAFEVLWAADVAEDDESGPEASFLTDDGQMLFGTEGRWIYSLDLATGGLSTIFDVNDEGSTDFDLSAPAWDPTRGLVYSCGLGAVSSVLSGPPGSVGPPPAGGQRLEATWARDGLGLASFIGAGVFIDPWYYIGANREDYVARWNADTGEYDPAWLTLAELQVTLGHLTRIIGMATGSGTTGIPPLRFNKRDDMRQFGPNGPTSIQHSGRQYGPGAYA